MPSPVLTAYARGRLGRTTVTLYTDGEKATLGADISPIEDFEGEGVIVKMLDIPVLRWGRLDINYGTAVLPSFTQISLLDPDGSIRALFPHGFDESAYLLSVSGPGSLRWYGRVRSASTVRPVASRVNLRTVRLDVYDRLGGLTDDVAAPTTERTIGEVVTSALWRANPHLRVYVFNDVWPQNIFLPQDIRHIRHGTEIAAGSDENDFGDLKEILDKEANYFGWKIFQGLDGAWWVIHRPAIGESVVVQVARRDGTADAWSLDVLTGSEFILTDSAVKGEEEDVIDGLPKVGTIKLTAPTGLGTGDVDELNLVTDGCFQFWNNPGTGPDFTFWEETGVPRIGFDPPAGCAGAAALDPGVAVSQDLISITAEINVRVHLFWQGFTVDTLPASGNAFIILEGNDSQTYYLNASGSWVTSPASKTQNIGTAGGWETDDLVAVEDFPVGGLLRIQFQGNTGDFHVSAVSCILEDDLGAPIADFVVSYGTGEGIIVEMERAPGMETDTDGAGAWLPPTGWESSRYQTDYALQGEYQAADRLAQQPDLDVLDVTLRGLYGPETRLRYDVDDDGFDEAFLASGLEIRLDQGETRGVWPQLPDARLEDVGGS